MSFHVHDWVCGTRSTGRPMRVQHDGLSDSDLLYDALARVAKELRREYPEYYAQVDALQARPGWQPWVHAGHDVPQQGQQYVMTECRYCGDDFATEQRKPATCCTTKCAARYRRWKNNRSKRDISRLTA